MKGIALVAGLVALIAVSLVIWGIGSDDVTSEIPTTSTVTATTSVPTIVLPPPITSLVVQPDGSTQTVVTQPAPITRTGSPGSQGPVGPQGPPGPSSTEEEDGGVLGNLRDLLGI